MENKPTPEAERQRLSPEAQKELEHFAALLEEASKGPLGTVTEVALREAKNFSPELRESFAKAFARFGESAKE